MFQMNCEKMLPTSICQVRKIMALIHVIYVSTANKKIVDADLDSILESSVSHNTKNDVTGLLLYVGNRFMQVIEGQEVAINETMARIAKDPRHTDLVVLERTAIANRSFDKWSMGFHRLNALEVIEKPGFAAFLEPDFDASKIGAKQGVALRMLREFVRVANDGSDGVAHAG
jgi:hypothetical protein